MPGHGHVTPNLDGMRARCGGPTICRDCALELARLHVASPTNVCPAPDPRDGLHPLDYQAPTEEQRKAMREVAFELKRAWGMIELKCPPSAERTLALRALQEARSRANEAILGITIPR